jgi:hypothetical protein
LTGSSRATRECLLATRTTPRIYSIAILDSVKVLWLDVCEESAAVTAYADAIITMIATVDVASDFILRHTDVGAFYSLQRLVGCARLGDERTGDGIVGGTVHDCSVCIRCC